MEIGECRVSALDYCNCTCEKVHSPTVTVHYCHRTLLPPLCHHYCHHSGHRTLLPLLLPPYTTATTLLLLLPAYRGEDRVLWVHICVLHVLLLNDVWRVHQVPRVLCPSSHAKRQSKDENDMQSMQAIAYVRTTKQAR